MPRTDRRRSRPDLEALETRELLTGPHLHVIDAPGLRIVERIGRAVRGGHIILATISSSSEAGTVVSHERYWEPDHWAREPRRFWPSAPR